MKKRIIAMALCLAMTLSLFPTGAFANPENEPAAPSSETVAELVQEQQTEALPEAAAETEKTENEAPAVPVTAEAEIAAEAEKAESEASSEPEKADSKPAEPEKAESEASSEPEKADSEPAEPEKAESEASSEPEKADSEPVESEAETAKEPAAENSGSKWDALKNSIGNLFGGAVQPFSITHDLKVDTYKFFVGEEEQTNWTQRVAVGDTLKIPGTPKPPKDGDVFEGWFAGDTEVKGGEIERVSGAEVIVKAQFKEASCYVYFMGNDGETVMYTAQGAKDDTVQPEDISTAEAKVRPTLKGNQSVQGWSTTKDGEPLSGSIQFTKGTLKLYPVVKAGYWVTFDSNGGSYIAPQFIIEDKTLKLSGIELPTRAGYKFTGWYNQDGEQVDTVSVEATVTAHWLPQSDVEYTVIYWLENADDDGYSFKEAETKTGTAGTKAEPSQKSYDGFTPNKDIESKTIAGDGSTILNVYYKRNVYEVKFYKTCGKEEHTHTQWCYAFGHLICRKEAHTHTDDCRKLERSISAKYGENISTKWPGGTWSVNADVSKGPWQVHIDTMPMGGKNFYGPKTGDGSATAYYYVEALPDKPYDTTVKDIRYKQHHTDTAPTSWGTVTKEDQYPITGFDFVEEISTKTGEKYNGAEFYYNRKKYDIKFINNGNVEETKTFKYQESIEGAGYEPQRPATVDKNFKFDGWYENAQCSGKAYVFENKTMPAKSINLYAKWAAPDITVTIPMKDGSEKKIEVPYRSKLAESAEWNDLLKTLHPQPEAWMINGKIFNLNTELDKDITLTPYYKTDATPYKITYVENDIPSWDDSTQYAKGSEATISNPKYTQHSEGLKFQYWQLDDGTTYLPGQSITVTGDVTLTAVYGEPPKNLTLTYHNGEDTKEFKNLLANSMQTAKDPTDSELGFKAPEDKWFAGWATKEGGEAEYPVGKEFYITRDGNNDLYAVWKNKLQITVEANSNTLPYNGEEQKVTGFVTNEFPVNGQKYTVSGLTAEGKGINAGEYPVKVTGTAVVKDAAGNDVTNQFTVTSKPGKLTITATNAEVVVTITGKTKTVTYNGKEQSVEGYKVDSIGNNLYKESDIKFTGTAVAKGTNADTYQMGLKADQFTNTNTNFKNVKFVVEDGKLVITPKNIVPGENNKDLTATAPKDVVYSGESQQQKPEVKDGDKTLVEGTDYTLTYSKDTTNAGIVTVTITGKGNYTGTVTRTYEITPAPLKITTNSAEKTYDESALTAGGKIEGVVEHDKDEVKLNITGSQTEVGSSQNTYEIEWGTAKETNYKIAEEDIGTLKVNARSGGGSSSKPTPEEEPTPTPTPTPLPTLPTTPAPTTPARRVTRSTATVTEPASRPTEQITENETPKAESEPEVIEDEETPLAPMATGAWALVNLILMLLTVLASLLLLLGYLGKKKYAKEDEYGNALHDANGNEIIDYTRNKKGFWRVASLIPAIAAVIAFALTENMRLPMVMTDRWTLLMVIIAVVQLIVAVLCKKKKESEEDENQANA